MVPCNVLFIGFGRLGIKILIEFIVWFFVDYYGF